MQLSFVEEIFNLCLCEAVHKLAGFGSNIRLRVGVKYLLNMDLASMS